jgi:hypothetical protein
MPITSEELLWEETVESLTCRLCTLQTDDADEDCDEEKEEDCDEEKEEDCDEEKEEDCDEEKDEGLCPYPGCSTRPRHFGYCHTHSHWGDESSTTCQAVLRRSIDRYNDDCKRTLYKGGVYCYSHQVRILSSSKEKAAPKRKGTCGRDGCALGKIKGHRFCRNHMQLDPNYDGCPEILSNKPRKGLPCNRWLGKANTHVYCQHHKGKHEPVKATSEGGC